MTIYSNLGLYPSVQSWVGFSAIKTEHYHHAVSVCSEFVFVINIWVIDKCCYKNANYDGFLIVLQPHQLQNLLDWSGFI